MTYNRVAVVTGSNKGIGLAIVRQLALKYPQSPHSNGSFLIYLTARDKGRGEEALKAIHYDEQLKRARTLKQDGGATEVSFHELDVSNRNSIRAFAEHLRTQHPNGIDAVVNNAGVALQGLDANVVRETLRSNYYGTLEATLDFLPLIRDGGRLVNVASTLGGLSGYSDSIRNRFLSAKSHHEITSLMESFNEAVANGTEKQEGWKSSAYAVSKAGVIGITRAVAMDQKQRGSKTLINACCPGYVQTDLTKGRGSKTPDQGAQTPVMLALEDIGGKTGLFWRDERTIEW